LLVQAPLGLQTTLMVPPDFLVVPGELVPHPATATITAATDSKRTRVRGIRDTISDLLHWMERPSWDSRAASQNALNSRHGRERPYDGQKDKRIPSGPMAGFSQAVIDCR
jgi:hypothetical protein